MTIDHPQFIFGSKSETLTRLKPLLNESTILPMIYFSQEDWQHDRNLILTRIRAFSSAEKLIIRSSAKNEDSHESSMAGAYLSCLNICINNETGLISAIEKVIGSFSEFSQADNQILIQPMLTDINMSGVIMTHDIERGSPYYVINYDDESGLTDTITGGVGIHKTVLIYRYVSRDKIHSTRIKSLLLACTEIEKYCANVPLDIEFAINKSGNVYIFQVRRITLINTWHPVTERKIARTLKYVTQFIHQTMNKKKGVYGKKTILGVMPDWNPAEIIGTTPRPLSSSLYRYLITDSIWRTSRAAMGYYHPKNEDLMVMIDHHPYIDVRNSFNTFLPDKLSSSIKEKLLNAWIARLEKYPEMHDKIEFEIVQTCLDFTFDQDFENRYKNLLSASELIEYRNALCSLTYDAILMAKSGTLSQATTMINELAIEQSVHDLQSRQADLSTVRDLLISCRDKGTYAFSILARHAFIAEALLRSIVFRDVLSPERSQQFKQSIHTITTNLASEYSEVCQGLKPVKEFLNIFGHLRPGTYDITSLRYDERNDLFKGSINKTITNIATSFTLNKSERKKLRLLLKEAQFSIEVEQLLTYMKSAIKGREFAKCVFTRDLSDALATLTQWGQKNGLSRKDLSYLDINILLDTLTNPLLDDPDRVLLHYVEKAKRECEQANSLKLGHLISNPNNVFVIPIHRSLANFITSKVVESALSVLYLDTPATTKLRNKIICIKNADPGYDWLFTKGIAGLITQYGGTNSHMAIRCAEFSIPAAIGCGEQLFSRILKSQKLVLNCRDKKIELL
ncbi:MAG: pyruvate, phosphate dikinase [Psychromonas sp.]|nr:pyruvate, phosphate dikinase [Psychromonas sp.]